MTRVLLIAAVVLLGFASTASARTIQQDLADAHAYWKSDVCGGAWDVKPDATLPDRGHRGEATGLYHYADGSWHIERCEFTVNPTLTGCQRYYVIAHEIGHFVHGPEHSGAMGAHGIGNAPCPIAATPRKRSSRAAMKARVKLRVIAARAKR